MENDMEEEYRWLASQGDDELLHDDGIEMRGDGRDNLASSYRVPEPSSRYQEQLEDDHDLHSIYSSYLLSTSKNKNLEVIQQQNPPSQDLIEERLFYDIDLMKSSLDLSSREQEGDIFSSTSFAKNHLEIAIIEISSQNSDPFSRLLSSSSSPSEDLLEDLAHEDDGSDGNAHQSSVLRIGDRVYSLTSSLISFLQNFIVTSSRFLLRSSLDLELSPQAQNKLNEMTEMSVKVLNQLSTLKAVGECLTESCYFAVDRTRTYTKW
jgi:hypothetical protein